MMKPVDHVLRLAILAAMLSGAVPVLPAVADDGRSAEEAAMAQRIRRAVESADQAVTQGKAPPAPNFDRLPMPAMQAPAPKIDAEALARKFNAVGQPPIGRAASLLAFVSFSMPKASLERLVADAETYGVTLVMRGLVNRNLKDTARAAQELIGTRKVGWLVDPQAFQRFGIKSVPSYVLVRANATPHACALRECFDDGDYVRLAGDVTTRYALEKIAGSAPTFGQDAAYIASRGVRP